MAKWVLELQERGQKGQGLNNQLEGDISLSKHECYQKHNICANFMPFLHKCYAFDNISVENLFCKFSLRVDRNDFSSYMSIEAV